MTNKTPANNNNAPNTNQTTQQILPIISNAQSPQSRTTKVPGSNNVSVSANVTSGYAAVRNSAKPDLINTIKNGAKQLERTLSPMSGTHAEPSMTTSANQAPTSAFAGAIKTLTQKYKTMHLTTSIDTTNTSQIPVVNHQPVAVTNLNLTSLNNSNNNSIMTPNFQYKNTYLNHSIDPTFINIRSGGDTNLTTQNSDSLSSSDDKQHVFSNKTPNTANRPSASNTPTFTRIANGNTNVEWTQMIKLSNGKAKSDLNNNDLISNNCAHTNQSNERSSLIHLSHQNGTNSNSNSNNASTGSSLHMPILSYNNNSNSSSNTNSVSVAPNRSTRSPVIKKVQSPINLPSIDASVGRSTPQ